jgi:hypothetical protein
VAAGYGAPAAPYTGFPDWQRNGVPGRHFSPGGHDGFVNRGDYAQVIREDDPAASSSRTRHQEWGRLGEWSPGNGALAQANGAAASPAGSPGAPARSASVRGRAITSGAAADSAGGEPRTARPAAASAATGANRPATDGPPASVPAAGTSAGTSAGAAAAGAAATIAPAAARSDTKTTPADSGLSAPSTGADTAGGARDVVPPDPGYGPPGPDWYRRTEEAPTESAAGQRAADAEESLAESRPFELAQHDERASAGQPADDGDGDGPTAAPNADLSEVPEFELAGFETPDLLDFGPDEPVDGALGGLRTLYQTAEAIGSDRLERNLDRLLDRQRKLITDYFTESGDLGPGDLDTSSVSIGFDSAQSLAGLRGELRASS